MSKIRITEEQYNKLISYMKKSILNESNDKIDENGVSTKEIIKEGYKDVILGVVMLLSQAIGKNAFTQTGHNKEVAINALKNKHIMGQIKSTLEDELKTQELIGAMEKQGLKNPDILLVDNAQKLIDRFNKVSTDNNLGYIIDTKGINNLKTLNGEIKETPTNDIKTTDVIIKTNNINAKDIIIFNFDADTLFVNDTYELTQSGSDSIKTIIEEIKNQDGIINSISVEISTNAEPTVKFKNKNDITGNIELLNLRFKTINKIINKFVNGVTITHKEIPNNGSNIVNYKEFMNSNNNHEVLNTLRQKTIEFRYLKLTIVAVFNKEIEHDNAEEVIKQYRHELINNINKKTKTKLKARFEYKKFKCKKSKINDRDTLTCETY